MSFLRHRRHQNVRLSLNFKYQRSNTTDDDTILAHFDIFIVCLSVFSAVTCRADASTMEYCNLHNAPLPPTAMQPEK